MTAMSSTLLRWLARRLVEAACRAVVRWAVDTCNTEPPILPTGAGERYRAEAPIRH